MNFQPVSFIVPAHNEANYIAATLAAIHRANSEVGSEYEIVVVNDDSMDQTKKLAVEGGAQVVDVALRNIGAVRNAGAKRAQYDWLIFVDADTLVPAETLRQTLQTLGTGHVGGGALVEIEPHQQLPWMKRLIFLAVKTIWQRIGRWAAGCYMFCDKAHFLDFGGFDEQYYAAEEYFFSRSLKARGKFRLVPHPVVTSARKLHAYSVWELVRFLIRPMLAGRNMFRSRTGLELLYDDQQARQV